MVMTARDIVTEAMRELKVIPAGAEPEASEIEDGLTRLNAMLGSWQTFTSQWRNTTIAAFPVDALASVVTLPADARNVSAVRIIDSYERPLSRWERDDYLATPTKTQRGRPLAYAENRERSSVTLSLWPIPSTDVVLAIDYQRKFLPITDASEELDIPDDWLEAAWTNLAVRMQNMYGAAAELSPELVNRAGTLLTALRDDDRPASYWMGAEGYA